MLARGATKMRPCAKALCMGSSHRACFHRLKPNTPSAEVAKALRSDGCVVLQSFISPKQTAQLNAELDLALAATSPGNAAVEASGAIPLDSEARDALYGANTKRLGDLLTQSATWRDELVNHDALHAICSQVLTPQTGDYWLSAAQMIELGPGSKAQPLHSDGGGWWPFWSMPRDKYAEYYLNFLIATTDTTCENGATGVVRGSQDAEYLSVTDLANIWQYPEEEVEQIELKAGDCLLLGGRIVHRGGENKTQADKRRILSCMVISSSLTPEEAHAMTVDRKFIENQPERVKKFLGFRNMRPIVGPGVWLHPKGELSSILGF
ncbi:hypothetical protein LMH87_006294 [Akanthomyces muscarius]|uniref:Phytanoyl-CoA dioxygenase n=1 Tax=Akanthomyces muscarius TaxID=2231603 RepID=A0A9W8QPA8_AKAMU|nr:hypothetical protein LMH87_006294 [Akanthomyces muscarius]KAJ4164630.1 hypothetical protein LMH87_006294 [Akanthomyces muscarius]